MMRDLNKEIEVVESIIEVLNKCLAIHKQENHHKQVLSCLDDINICKKELQRLIEERKMMLI